MSSNPFKDHGFTDIDISVYHLIFLANSIEKIVKGFVAIIDKIEDDDEKAIYVSSYSLVTIQTISFLDEFSEFRVPPTSALYQDILFLRKGLKPAIKALQQWKEMRDFRSNVLAHNLRNQKDNQNSVFQRGLDSYDAPKNGHDLGVLISCVSIIRQVLEQKFGDRQQQLRNFIQANRKPSIPARYLTQSETSAAIESIVQQVSALLASRE
jgi:hypothetical protein